MHSPSASPVNTQHMLHFIEASSEATTTGDIVELFWQALQNYGYNQIDFAADDELEEPSDIANASREIVIPLYGPSGLTHAVWLRRSPAADNDSACDDICHIMAAQCHKMRAELDNGPAPITPDIELTDREKDILLWSSRGKSNSVIGDILGVTTHGVKFHMANILKKLGVTSRVSATVKAIRYGLINP